MAKDFKSSRAGLYRDPSCEACAAALATDGPCTGVYIETDDDPPNNLHNHLLPETRGSWTASPVYARSRSDPLIELTPEELIVAEQMGVSEAELMAQKARERSIQ